MVKVLGYIQCCLHFIIIQDCSDNMMLNIVVVVKGLCLLLSTCFTHIHWSINKQKCLIIFSVINKISESNLTSDLFDIRCHDTLDSGRTQNTISNNHRALSLLSHLVIVIIQLKYVKWEILNLPMIEASNEWTK